MPLVTPDIESTTQPIKGRRTMKKSKMSSKDGFKPGSFTGKTSGAKKYRKQVIKGKKSKNTTMVTTGGPRYGGA